MRGKGASWKCLIDCKGITPAYAGKSRLVQCRNVLDQDHPRLCGEKSAKAALTLFTRGSPPPMRGKGFPLREPRSSCRITPAYAGKSERQNTMLLLRQDHPRLCGEKVASQYEGTRVVGITPAYAGKSADLKSVIFPLRGSPPPMRGKGILHSICGIGIRITPAYAGKRPRR